MRTRYRWDCKCLIENSQRSERTPNLRKQGNYSDRFWDFLLRRTVFMPGSARGASTEGISQSYCSNCCCASAMLVASEVRPQFGQKCSLVAGFHLMRGCFMGSPWALSVANLSCRMRRLNVLHMLPSCTSFAASAGLIPMSLSLDTYSIWQNGFISLNPCQNHVICLTEGLSGATFHRAN